MKIRNNFLKEKRNFIFLNSLKSLLLCLQIKSVKSIRNHTPAFFKYAFVTWLIIILFVSSIPNLSTPHIRLGHSVFRLDYLFHITQYFILLFLYVLWRGRNSHKLSIRMFVFTLLIGFSVAAIDETHQLIIPGRTFNPMDMASNFVGVFTGLLVGWWFFQDKRDNLETLPEK